MHGFFFTSKLGQGLFTQLLLFFIYRLVHNISGKMPLQFTEARGEVFKYFVLSDSNPKSKDIQLSIN